MQFLRTARGSAFECTAHLLLCPVPGVDTAPLVAEYHRFIEALDLSLSRLVEADAV